jgi:hypothetical protein
LLPPENATGNYVKIVQRVPVKIVLDPGGLNWPEPHLYHAMFNTEMGESCTATMLIECVQQFERDAE